MEWLKHYLTCNHRIGRESYVIAFVLLMLVPGAVAGIMIGTFAGNLYPDQLAAIATISEQEKNHTVTKQEADSKWAEIKKEIEKSWPSWTYFIGFIPVLLFLPAIAMRLKDLNYTPQLALLFLIPYLLSVASHFVNIMFPSSALTDIIADIFYLLLMFIRGTDGINKYGVNPVQAVA